jgi:hypothetical protein
MRFPRQGADWRSDGIVIQLSEEDMVYVVEWRGAVGCRAEKGCRASETRNTVCHGNEASLREET